MTVKIDGREVAADVRADVARSAKQIFNNSGEKIGLAVLLVGDDPASQVYVRLKEKALTNAGMISYQSTLPDNISQMELLELIDKLNGDRNVNGILVQLPLPDHLDETEVLVRIDPDKDVDGFHPANVGLLAQKLAKLMPCTPAGCIELLDRYKISMEGKHAVVVGRSNIVGKPVGMMLLHRNATVTTCHSRTKDLGEITRQADILIAAIGRPNTITADMVKDGAAIIDVGINRVDGALVGDVDYDGVYDKAGWITPVPGGVGPMTIAMLLYNTLLAYKIQRGLLV